MKKIIIPITIITLIITSIIIYSNIPKKSIQSKPNPKENTQIMPKLQTTKDLDTFMDTHKNIKVSVTSNYSTQEKNTIIYQSIKEKSNLTNYKELEVTISQGPFNKDQMQKDNINELGKIPIMMYHGIVNINSNDTKYTGGNVDKDGYTRTAESFKQDLEFYYQNNYRMIKLKDYINGTINTEYGKSPIIITFDDGNENNIKVTKLDKDGNIVIDPNSAVGILESFKKKYPDYHVTATFFVNETLFNQEEYNDKILKWLIDNDYDIGNHTKGHIDIKKSSQETVNNSIGYVYNQLDTIIPNQYVNIIALPFGSPYTKENPNFKTVLNSTYNNKTYETVSTLRVGWEPESSPFDKTFDKTFLKRCRAYDNNGKDFDIEMVFNNLKTTKYISDGSSDTIVIPCNNQENINSNIKNVKCY